VTGFGGAPIALGSNGNDGDILIRVDTVIDGVDNLELLFTLLELAGSEPASSTARSLSDRGRL
jgi:hypothetical protein